MTSDFKKLNVAVGNFLFRYRNGLFPIIYVLLLLITRPTTMFGNPILNHLWIISGAILAILGQLCRLITIGFKYIERGGKKGKVYASFLVQGGVYAHSRNPMYVGNALIAIGLLMYSGSSRACAIGIPLFLFVYQAITSAEENYLSSKFGKDFETYRSTVNRFFPSLRNLRPSFSGLTFDWRRALRKDYGTMAVVALFLIWLPLWRSYFHLGKEAVAKWLPVSIALSLIILLTYVVVRFLKKSGRLEKKESSLADNSQTDDSYLHSNSPLK